MFTRVYGLFDYLQFTDLSSPLDVFIEVLRAALKVKRPFAEDIQPALQHQ